MKKINKKGFTLAEVLITIGIIGVVASLTIPTLIANYQKSVYVAQLQKFYAEFQAGAKAFMTEEGCTDLQCTDAFEGSTDVCSWAPDSCAHVEGLATKSFKIAQDFQFNGTGHKAYYIAQMFSNLSPDFLFENSTYSFITADNFLVGIKDPMVDNCSLYGDICAEIEVDVNGLNGPDIIGRDVFQFYLTKNGALIPQASKTLQDRVKGQMDLGEALNEMLSASFYWKNSISWCGDPTNKSFKEDDGIQGYGCAARIMENGWKMDY